jgi:hypothetical protein
MQLALAVADPPGEIGDAAAVDDAVTDQSHRPGNGVGALPPLG